ncbi:MAG: hypothetical protein SYNGOMJ08_00615 [Candidatus Syntrophoarchaeum sp. GoM_oil]|nr:MAG: hypothetical protein SYNGOMJ08_00615 [Candidatus Syntrophoarchaeum sp. GoM_oil]
MGKKIFDRIRVPLAASIALAVVIVTIAFGIRHIAINGKLPFALHYVLFVVALTFVIGIVILNHENDLNTIIRGGVFAILASFIVVTMIGGFLSFIGDSISPSLLLSSISICIILSAIMLRVFFGSTYA